MGTRKYSGIRLSEGRNTEDVTDSLTIEAPLTISVNGSVFTITMRTPGDDEDLVRGLLHAEDVYRDKQTNPHFVVKETADRHPSHIEVAIPEDKLRDGYMRSRNLLSASSCGICGISELQTFKKSHDDVHAGILLDIGRLKRMFDEMEANQHHFNESGGSHAAAIFDKDMKLIAIAEDIGRHNAVDKVVGRALNAGRLDWVEFLLVSGRVSYEIVTKCFSAGIPYLAAVSAPSSLAVDFARELGITLMGFTRGAKTTVYSHFERVLNSGSGV